MCAHLTYLYRIELTVQICQRIFSNIAGIKRICAHDLDSMVSKYLQARYVQNAVVNRIIIMVGQKNNLPHDVNDDS